MATPDIPPRDSRAALTASPLAGLVDEVLVAYVDWLEAAVAVTYTYRRWADAPAAQQAARFRAYTAALDHEEVATIAYSGSIDQLERWMEFVVAE